MADAAAIGGEIWEVRRVLEWLSGEEVVLSVLE
jgi:hypothetical protein